ncbi:hypothetical protein BBJ28_00013876 [Nothophytophthora sp. Chile5]|nr:hypothetical protein BBJ28_00013876 [Nothophytophthora sp. Chile5]
MATHGGGAEDSDVFEDLDSDASDFADDGDVAFSDGDVLELMAEMPPPQADHSVRGSVSDCAATREGGQSPWTEEAAAQAEALLDELFPAAPRPEPTSVEGLGERGSPGRSSGECEVEWALVALEEHEQRGRDDPPQAQDFVALFEELYGGDTAIALTTPSPPAKAEGGGLPLKNSLEALPPAMLALLQTVHEKAVKASAAASKPSPCVLVRQYRPSKLRVRCKVYNSEDRELTFRPKINPISRRSKRLQNAETPPSTADFAARMQSDIQQRRLQLQRLAEQREQLQRQEEEANSAASATLIAKGSQRILRQNGRWQESTASRLGRLARRHGESERTEGAEASRSRRRRRRQQLRKQQTAAVASRACESLYQRGLRQRKREELRRLEDAKAIDRCSQQPKMSGQSTRQEEVEVEAESVTFVEFSCVLLYFGLVSELETPWSRLEDGEEVTVLWHAWMVFTREIATFETSRLAVKALETVLFAVLLGQRVGGSHHFGGPDVNVLLRLFRANYLSRKRTQAPAASPVGTPASQAAEHGKRPKTSVHYSLHGRPIRGEEALETDLLSERGRLQQDKLAQLRLEKQQKELEGCTFQPQLLARTEPSRPADGPEATASAFERLYADAFQRQRQLVTKYLKAKQHREEQETRESAIRPGYLAGRSIEERLQQLQVALASNAIPVDFHKKVDAMRTASELKASEEQQKAQRLLPTRFKRNQHGCTIVQPFRLATELRAASGSTFSSRKQARDRVMKGLRPLSGPLKPQEDEQEERSAASVCLDVHLRPSESHELRLRLGADPLEAVDRFALRHALTKTQREALLELAETRLEELSDLQV